ncbi:LacI family DNA-binding transcriptional regulator [Ruficoccus sp. ZRK36]|uniref:LacI family DNA-binding transcriptional regulator n=1 Tax=Ruficoccus sp. ZRK36 TaxID=2866311 RepID=UPI001C72A243|nr:LacI family DNA-binding transcriptional regulator [Ruficoccus sp. ZRK36]QYY37450.1 LacI family transcriptional regulator [Ruficoccus sp. ZRK36]
MEPPRVTQSSIAKKLGLTQSTVSRALRNDSSIPPDTRAEVQRVAQELNYSPDPYLSGLASYRKRTKAARFHANLAWISNDSDGRTWRSLSIFEEYHAGASERAAELGYTLEDFALRSEGMSHTRMERILHARGIDGLLLAPQPNPNTILDFSFEQFSAIAFGYTLVKPQLHVVTMHHARSMKIAFSKLIEMGYQRPGMAVREESDARVDHSWSNTFNSLQRQHFGSRERIPTLISKNFTDEIFLKWFQKHRPDVVISINIEPYGWLQEAGVRVPQETGFAMISVQDNGELLSGIHENPKIIGAKAVDFLIEMINRRERGVPDVPVFHLIDGRWVDGQTVAYQS